MISPYHGSYEILLKCPVIDNLKCDSVQGPPGPGGLPGEMGKTGPPVSRDRDIADGLHVISNALHQYKVRTSLIVTHYLCCAALIVL